MNRIKKFLFRHFVKIKYLQSMILIPFTKDGKKYLHISRICQNGVRNMKNRLLIGVRLRSIRRFTLDVLKTNSGRKDILQNMNMGEYIHGVMEQHHGAVMQILQPYGNLLN